MNSNMNAKRVDKNVWLGTPEPGHVLVNRMDNHYKRSVNGAWLPGGCSERTFEIPVCDLNTPAGAAWLSPGRTEVVVVQVGGSYLSISGHNDPLRCDGFGVYGEVTPEEGPKFRTCFPNLNLPNIGTGYYRLRFIPDEDLTTFSPLP